MPLPARASSSARRELRVVSDVAERLVGIDREDRRRRADRRHDPAARRGDALGEGAVTRLTEDRDPLPQQGSRGSRGGSWPGLRPAARRHPAGERYARLFDRPHDDHSRGTRVAERVVVPERDAEVRRHHVQPVTREFWPGLLRHPDAVQPRRLDRRSAMDAAGGCERALVEVRVGDRRALGQVRIDDAVYIGEARLPDNVLGPDAMHTDVETAELVERIDQRLVFECDATIAEADVPTIARTPVVFSASQARTMPATDPRSTTPSAGMPSSAAVANSSSGLDAPRRKLKCVVTCIST